MSELVAFGETTGVNYEKDRLVLDTALLNYSGHILLALHSDPFSPSNYEVLRNAQGQSIALNANKLLNARFDELDNQNTDLRGLYEVEQAKAKLERVRQEWISQYLLTHAEEVDYQPYVDWLESATRYHPRRLKRAIHADELVNNSPVYRAFADIHIDVHIAPQYHYAGPRWLPSVLVVPPGIKASAVSESDCYIAEWDAIGTSRQLRAPVDDTAETMLNKQLRLDQTQDILNQHLGELI